MALAKPPGVPEGGEANAIKGWSEVEQQTPKGHESSGGGKSAVQARLESSIKIFAWLLLQELLPLLLSSLCRLSPQALFSSLGLTQQKGLCSVLFPHGFPTCFCSRSRWHHLATLLCIRALAAFPQWGWLESACG